MSFNVSSDLPLTKVFYICAGLQENANGTHETINFSTDAFVGIYQIPINLLVDLKTTSAPAYHRLKRQLYTKFS